MLTRLGQVLCGTALLLSFQLGLAEGANSPLPAWVSKAIAERRASRSRDVIEESTYNGKRVFEFVRGDVADTGDEHTLFSEDGKEICQFGGFVGHVTRGACDFQKTIYVRTLYPAKSQ
jgi:hypothetical protein